MWLQTAWLKCHPVKQVILVIHRKWKLDHTDYNHPLKVQSSLIFFFSFFFFLVCWIINVNLSCMTPLGMFDTTDGSGMSDHTHVSSHHWFLLMFNQEGVAAYLGWWLYYFGPCFRPEDIYCGVLFCLELHYDAAWKLKLLWMCFRAPRGEGFTGHLLGFFHFLGGDSGFASGFCHRVTFF